MGDSVDLFAVSLSLVIPWVSGTILARLFLGPSLPASLYFGHGYLLGYAIVITWLRFTGLLGFALNYWLILALVFSTGLASVLLVTRGSLRPLATPSFSSAQQQGNTDRRLPTWQLLILITIMMLTFTQLKFIYDEIILRPTFAWDAWRGWEPETLQQFRARSLMTDMDTVTNYGMISSDIQLWTMLAAGIGKAPITHITWLFAYTAIALALYGHLRVRFGVLRSALGSFACLSLPYLAIQAALAGYADIWLCLAFTLGMFSLMLYRNGRHLRLFLLCAMYIVATLVSKRAGIALSLALIACLIFTHIRWTPGRIAAFICVPALLAASLLLAVNGYIGLSIAVPALGLLELNESYIKLPFVQQYTFQPSTEVWHYIEAIFIYGSWHLSFFLLAGSTLILMFSRSRAACVSLQLFGIFTALTLVGGFFVAMDPESAKDQTALSRALLYVLPLIIHTFLSVAVLPHTTSPQLMRALSPPTRS